MGNIQVQLSDLQKVRDTLKVAYDHHLARDQMNAYLHLAQNVRLSPLTSEISSAVDRLNTLLAENE